MQARKRNILNDEICTREQFLESYHRQGNGERATAILDKSDIFPLTYSNPKFAHLNVLGLYVYLSGALTKADRNRYDAMISGGRKHQRDITDLMESELGMTFRKSENDWEFAENGAVYARLLSLMGFHTSNGTSENIERKAATGSQLPKYLTNIIENYDALDARSRKLGRRLLKDLIGVCFDAKAYARHTSLRSADLELELLTQPSRALIRKQAHDIIGSIAIAYPQVGVREDQIRVHKIRSADPPKYEGRISIPMKQALRFPTDGASSAIVAIQLCIKPSRYSFEIIGGRRIG